MRIGRDELKKFDRPIRPVPAPVKPVLPAAEEAALIVKDKGADPTVPARRARVLAILHRPAPPEGTDAALVALLAEAKALPLADKADRLAARQRLMDIGRSAEPPPEVAELFASHGIRPGDATAFADLLLPPNQDTGGFHESGAGFLTPP